MKKNTHNTEKRIFQAACNVFLLYGYHGASFQQIAITADVHKSAIHYYFRSKERLYYKVVSSVIADILNTDIHLLNKELIYAQRWFLITELYNNKSLFEDVLKELFGVYWKEKLYKLKKVLKIKQP